MPSEVPGDWMREPLAKLVLKIRNGTSAPGVRIVVASVEHLGRAVKRPAWPRGGAREAERRRRGAVGAPPRGHGAVPIGGVSEQQKAWSTAKDSRLGWCRA